MPEPLPPVAAVIEPPAGLFAAIAGLQGPAGAPGPSGTHYQHTQAAAASVWTINHNLGYRPAVSLLTPGGVVMLAEVVHASVNQALAYFDNPVAGLAVCS